MSDQIYLPWLIRYQHPDLIGNFNSTVGYNAITNQYGGPAQNDDFYHGES